jgi:hypothetical protein
MRLAAIFRPDHERYHGVRPSNIFLLRLVFLLVFVALGPRSWSTILTHEGAWNHFHAVAYCMFGAYSGLSLIGVFHPLKMLPLMLFLIIYKLSWLVIVAYPLWSAGLLAGSPAEPMAKAFVWVVLCIVATPWKYALDEYVLKRTPSAHSPHRSIHAA